MRRLRWEILRLRDQAGWPGIAGIALLAGCLGFYVTMLAPAERRVADARESAVAAGEARRGVERGFEGSGSPRSQLIAFYRYFETDETLEDRLAKLQAAADATGVVLKRAEYRMVRDGSGRLLRYEIVLPVSSRYPNIRSFINTVLASLPTVSLDLVTFQRKRVSDPTVDADLRFSVYLLQQS